MRGTFRLLSGRLHGVLSVKLNVSSCWHKPQSTTWPNIRYIGFWVFSGSILLFNSVELYSWPNISVSAFVTESWVICFTASALVLLMTLKTPYIPPPTVKFKITGKKTLLLLLTFHCNCVWGCLNQNGRDTISYNHLAHLHRPTVKTL